MDASNLIVYIIGMAIALVIFAQLAPGISAQLVAGNFTTNATAAVLVPLVTVAFVAGILLTVLKGAMHKS